MGRFPRNTRVVGTSFTNSQLSLQESRCVVHKTQATLCLVTVPPTLHRCLSLTPPKVSTDKSERNEAWMSRQPDRNHCSTFNCGVLVWGCWVQPYSYVRDSRGPRAPSSSSAQRCPAGVRKIPMPSQQQANPSIASHALRSSKLHANTITTKQTRPLHAHRAVGQGSSAVPAG